MNKPLVSIIIPTYNRAHFLGETLESIIDQTYKSWECIVVDDGSTDYTEELMDFYSNRDHRIKYICRPENRRKGANSCRNYGFEVSSGEYINWFDSDDLMHKDKLELQVSVLVQDNHNFIVCQSMVFEGRLTNLKGLRSPEVHSKNLVEDYIIKRIFFPTSALLCSKKFISGFSKIFDEELQAAQEWEFFTRLISQSESSTKIDKPLVFFREHEENITNQEAKEITKWNYFLARYKVYTNQEIEKSSLVLTYLENYLLYYFKNVTINRHFQYSLKSYKKFILRSTCISGFDKFKGALAMGSYLLLNKGYFLISRIELKD